MRKIISLYRSIVQQHLVLKLVAQNRKVLALVDLPRIRRTKLLLVGAE